MNKSPGSITEAEKRMIHELSSKRGKAEIKYPLLFGLMTTFGFVSVLYGFEKLIDKIDLFVNNPWILFVVGVLILMATGTAYKKLS